MWLMFVCLRVIGYASVALFKVLFEELISVVESDDIRGSTRFTV
jgi:hypothetical protein